MENTQTEGHRFVLTRSNVGVGVGGRCQGLVVKKKNKTALNENVVLWLQVLEFFYISLSNTPTTKWFQDQERWSIWGGTANIHHTLLTLITLKQQLHKDLVNCQPLYFGAKAVNHCRQALWLFLCINQQTVYINYPPLGKNSKEFNLDCSLQYEKQVFLLDLVPHECCPSHPSFQLSCQTFDRGFWGLTARVNSQTTRHEIQYKCKFFQDLLMRHLCVAFAFCVAVE